MEKEKSIFKIVHLVLLSLITLSSIFMEGIIIYSTANDPTTPWFVPLLTLAVMCIVLGCIYAISIFVYKDAPKYNMDRWMWMFLSTFLPNLLGFLLYFIIRKEKKSSKNISCVSCGNLIDSNYKICPYCGRDLSLKCKNCNEKISPDWNVCPKCGDRLK